MKKLTIICLSYFLLFACTSSRLLKKDEASYNEINRILMGRGVILELNNGEEISSSNIVIDLDSTKVDGISIPTTSINKIKKSNHFLGTISGAIGGAIVGMGIGYFVGTVSGFENRSANSRIKAIPEWSVSSEPVQSGVALGGTIGLLIGGIYGGLNAPNDVLILNLPENN